MKNSLQRAIISIALLLTVLASQAQTSPSKAANIKTVLSADSLASGNWKDVLTSFFQLSFDKLTSDKKELNFQSNPFAILLKSHPEAAIDTNYVKYKTLRKINFGFGLKLDSSYRFNGFTSGLRYAILNRRDTAVSKLLFNQIENLPLRKQNSLLFNKLLDSIEQMTDATKRSRFLQQANQLFNAAGGSFNKLDPEFQALVLTVAGKENLSLVTNLLTNKPGTNLSGEELAQIAALKKDLQNALLWTVSFTDTTYKDQFFFSNILLKTDLLKGMGASKPGANWELNMQAGVNFVDDSTRKGRDLSRSLLRFEPGFNLVFRNKANDQSFFEAKFSGSYIHNFGNLYRNERRDSVSVNATLRVRIIGDVWIPLEIKYDPRSGNVLGFLNIRANFSGLKALISNLGM